MKILKLTGILAMFAFAALFIMSCEDTTTNPVNENPVINSVSPTEGYIGMEVTITGSNFGEANDPGSVKFGGIDAPDQNYVSWTPTKIVVKVPTGAKTGKVVVVNNTKESNGVDFTVAPDKPEAPANLMATAQNSTTVILKWDAAPGAAWSIFKDYVLDVTGGAPMASISIDKSKTTYNVTGLEEGIVYTFTLKSRYTNDAESTTGVQVMWSPASRYTEVNSQSIRVYETDSKNGSGLDLFYADDTAPRIWTIAFSDNWNLGLYTKNDVLHFGPATSLGYTYDKTPQKTEMGSGDEYYVVNALDEALDNISMTTNINYGTTYKDLNTLDLKGKNAAVFLVRTEETTGKWNYAKVMVKKTGGKWLQGTSPDRYLEVEISYQKISDVPYAKTPGKNAYKQEPAKKNNY